MDYGNQQIYYLINIYFFVACVEQLKPIGKRYLGNLLGFQNYYDLQNNYQTFYSSVTYLTA